MDLRWQEHGTGGQYGSACSCLGTLRGLPGHGVGCRCPGNVTGEDRKPTWSSAQGPGPSVPRCEETGPQGAGGPKNLGWGVQGVTLFARRGGCAWRQSLPQPELRQHSSGPWLSCAWVPCCPQGQAWAEHILPMDTEVFALSHPAPAFG